jgi:hypothetical protein
MKNKTKNKSTQHALYQDIDLFLNVAWLKINTI